MWIKSIIAITTTKLFKCWTTTKRRFKRIIGWTLCRNITMGGCWNSIINTLAQHSRRLWKELARFWNELCSLEGDSDMLFAVRIAALISIAFSVKCALYNWADPKLSSLIIDGVPYANKVYWMGHWVHLFTILMFFGNFWLLIRLSQVFWRMLLPLCFTFSMVILVSLIDIHPHLHIQGSCISWGTSISAFSLQYGFIT